MPDDPAEEITTAEACELLGVTHSSTVTRYVAEGKLSPSRRVPVGRHGAFLFRRSDVVALAERRRQELLAAANAIGQASA